MPDLYLGFQASRARLLSIKARGAAAFSPAGHRAQVTRDSSGASWQRARVRHDVVEQGGLHYRGEQPFSRELACMKQGHSHSACIGGSLQAPGSPRSQDTTNICVPLVSETRRMLMPSDQ